MPGGMRAPINGMPTSPIGHPDVLWGLPGQGGLLTEWAETVPDLTWPDSVRTYGRMRRDARITAVLTSFFLPILRTTWAVDPEGVDRDEAVNLVATDLGLPVLGEKKPVTDSPVKGFTWHEHVRLALLNLVYGHMPFEQWYEVRGGQTHLAGVQERQPHTVAIIDIADDGQVRQVFQNTQQEPIPANRLVWYAHEREGANWAGVSMLRSCYTPWVLKHEVLRVHATAIRRFGMGVPTVIAPPGATPAMVVEAQRLAAGMRAGDTAGAGMPDGYEFRLTGLTGSAPDAVGFLQYLDQQISGSALAQIVELAHGTYGSRALGESFLDLFLLALQAAADAVGDTATFGTPSMPGLARSLVEYNWGEGEPVPKIRATDVGDRHEITAEALNLLIAVGALNPDPNLETFIRNAWGLPEKAEVNPPPPAPGPGAPPAAPGAPGAPEPGQPGTETKPAVPGGQQTGTPAPAAPASPGGSEVQSGRRPRWLRPFRGRAARPKAPGSGPAAGLRRNLTAVEAAAGMEPLVIRDEAQAEVDKLRARWEPVARDMRQDISGKVAAAVDAGQLPQATDLAPDTGPAADLLTAAMTDMAWTGARRMVREAASQGVTIPLSAVHIDDARIAAVAQARAALIGHRLAAEASRKTLTVVKATAGTDAADSVGVHLDGLSDTPLADQLAAAMTAAQNMGRMEAATAGLELGNDAVFTASEILDQNTCEPCDQVDGTEFASMDEADAAYPNGGYIDCDGADRCRGTVVAVWDRGVSIGEEAPPEEGPPPEEEAAPAEDQPDVSGLPSFADLLARWAPGGGNVPITDELIEAVDGTFGTGGLRAQVSADRSYVNETGLRIRGKVLDPAGNDVGEFARRIWQVPVEGTTSQTRLVAENAQLSINETWQGQGFASAFNKQMDALYRRAGVTEVRLYANLTVGGFAWARAGWDFETQASAEVLADRFASAVIVAKAIASGAAERPAAAGSSPFIRAVLGLADNPAALARAEGLANAVRSEQFGSAAFPTPFDFANVGYAPGESMWPGKGLLLGSGWNGVKPL